MRSSKLVSLVLLLLLLSPLVEVASVSSAPTTSQAWWNSSYGFRRNISVSNTMSAPFVNAPVVLNVGFKTGQVVDAMTDLRLVNATGFEVPSFVINEHYTGTYVSSATLLFIVNMSASSSEGFDLYYGNPSAALPSYRPDQATSGFTNGEVSVSIAPSRPSSDAYTLTYGGTFSESLISKVLSPGNSQGSGSSEISNLPYSNDTGWRLAGASSTPSVQVASDTVSAGSISLTKVLLAFPRYVVGLAFGSSQQSVSPQTWSYVQVVNATGLSMLGEASTQFSPQSDLLTTSVASSVVGFLPSATPGAYSVGSLGSVVDQAASGTLLSHTSHTGPSGGVFSWSLEGSLPDFIGFGWTVGPSLPQVRNVLGSVAIVTNTEVGLEEDQSSFLPVVSLTFTGSIPFTNLLVASKGVQIPLTVLGGSWLPGTISLGGTFSYEAPGPIYSTQSSGWTPSSGSSGNATALSTSSFYSVSKGTNVGRLYLSSTALNATGYSSLLSSTFTVVGGSGAQLVIGYQASFETSNGTSSSQPFYAALDIVNSFNGLISKTLFFPVSGSSNSTSAFSCGSVKIPSPLPSGSTSVLQSGYLIADGTWRTLNISLSSLSPAAGFQGRLRFCSSTSGSFEGSMQLLLSTAYVSVHGQLTSLLGASMTYASPTIYLSYLSAGTYSLPSVSANGEVNFSLVESMQPNNLNGTAFGGLFSSPLARVNATNGHVFNSSIPLKPGGLAVVTQFAPLLRSLSVDGLGVGAATEGGLVYSNDLPSLSAGVLSFSSTFQGYGLTVAVNDADGKPISGVQLSFSTPGAPPYTVQTGSGGTAVVDLLPWDYQIGGAYLGASVISSSEFLNGTSTLTLNANVYEMSVAVTNGFNRALPGAQVQLGSGNYNLTGLTNSGGLFTFQAPANQVFSLTVSVGGSQLYQGNIRATPNNAQVEVGTTYYPPSVTFGIIATVAGMAVAISTVLYLFRYRGRPK